MHAAFIEEKYERLKLKKILFLIVYISTSFGQTQPLTPDSTRSAQNPAKIEFVLIRGGSFEMGDIIGIGEPDQKPVHTVKVSDFYLGRTEVTVAQYRTFCKATGRRMPQAPGWLLNDDHPIINVSWNDAKAFCEWAGCRLPTEAEWEYAARNRGDSLRYSWGNDSPFDKAGGNVADESAKKQNLTTTIFDGYDDGYAKTAPVASFNPNALGLYDMTGNVWEWCADWYGKYGEKSQIDPKGPDSGSFRVLRGGSWINDPESSVVTNRFKNRPNIWYDCYGFRVAR